MEFGSFEAALGFTITIVGFIFSLIARKEATEANQRNDEKYWKEQPENNIYGWGCIVKDDSKPRGYTIGLLLENNSGVPVFDLFVRNQNALGQRYAPAELSILPPGRFIILRTSFKGANKEEIQSWGYLQDYSGIKDPIEIVSNARLPMVTSIRFTNDSRSAWFIDERRNVQSVPSSEEEAEYKARKVVKKGAAPCYISVRRSRLSDRVDTGKTTEFDYDKTHRVYVAEVSPRNKPGEVIYGGYISVSYKESMPVIEELKTNDDNAIIQNHKLQQSIKEELLLRVMQLTHDSGAEHDYKKDKFVKKIAIGKLSSADVSFAKEILEQVNDDLLSNQKNTLELSTL